MTWFFREEFDVLDVLGNQFAFPDNYFVTDVETCGFSFARDFIVDVGWAVVRNRRLENQENLLLNWSAYPHVDHYYIQQQLRRVEQQYREIGRPFYYPWERLCDEGEPPLEVLHAYTTLIYEHIKRDGQLVGHGLWRFDRKMIDSHTQRFLQGYLLPWRLNSIFDTGLLEKAAQMGRPPYDTETLDEWSTRINNANAKGVKWNLEAHCVPKYHLVERLGVDMALMHTAGFDCELIHYLLETYRQLTEILRGEKSEIVLRREEGGPQGETTHGQTGSHQGPTGLQPVREDPAAAAQALGGAGPGE